ncbi:MAG: DUF4034 domain-containing protein [Vicinamibacteria bacterium]
MAADRARQAHRQVVRLLVLLGLGGVAIAAVLALLGHNYYRLYRHGQSAREGVVRVESEAHVRERFGAEVRARLQARDFAGLDAQAAELRRTRETFAGTSVPKLTQFYRALGDRGPRPEAEWTRSLDLMDAWIRERPASVTARVGAAEMTTSYAWDARGDGWSSEVPEDRMLAFHQRLEQAHRLVRGADGLSERCPRRAATLLHIANGLSWPKDEEQRLYEEAVREFPDEQTYHTLHLRYLQPIWHGAPGDWQAAGQRILELPGGPEKYAYAVWHTSLGSRTGRELVSWPALKRGFDAISARHPDWFEAKSAYCAFASMYVDKATTQRLLADIGYRMDPSVWSDQEWFVRTHQWAEYEDSERDGADPLARVFSWFMR